MLITKTLDVPYFAQPTPITCQSTCLKMYGRFLESKRAMSTGGADQSIEQIWKEINTGNERPVQGRNAYANMKWWLEKHFSPQRFRVFQTDYVQTAMNFVKRQIDAGFPIMVSTNHDRTAGHIILVIGYRSTPGQVSGGVDFVCHDPFGKFDPQLGSHQYGKRRYEGGMSLSAGSEHGPGRAVVYDHDGIRRIRADKHSSGKFFMISAQT